LTPKIEENFVRQNASHLSRARSYFGKQHVWVIILKQI